MDRKRTIVMEHEDNLLVRINAIEELGGRKYNLVSYEIWTNREKFNQDIPVEWVGNDQYIYCSNHATNNEESMIQTFNSQFKPKRIDVCSRCGRDIYEGDEVWYQYVDGEPPFTDSEKVATCGVCEKEETRKFNASY